MPQASLRQNFGSFEYGTNNPLDINLALKYLESNSIILNDKEELTKECRQFPGSKPYISLLVSSFLL